ncbi:ABC transporter ATP-binding protein [Paenibacillus aceris]|uniref:ATP-binding cassette subfamily C protein n=1 Tax=Paenibacillus aceris TaxID=869555 RepID=A0ABS4I861_9BACL|nr:ABC transporter ATP-binding protein [Paenibacillus aceris]MBP1967050.1 ATP-binding cassette subfamily C protein [Paenibacillus aceris]NHW33247.1 ABC transporter ATP-binding protein [Paenibacillus aceris]
MKAILYFVQRLYSTSGNILYMNLLGMILISLIEGIGVIILIPMLSMSGIINMNTDLIPLSVIFQFLQNISETWKLSIILGIYFLLVLGQGFLKRTVTISNSKIHQGFMHHLRTDTFGSLLQANWDFHIKRRKSDFVNSLTSEIGGVSGGMNTLLQMVTSLVFTFIQICFAFWLSAKLAIFVLICGLIVALLFRRFVHRSKSIGQQTTELSKSYHAGITDQLNGIKDIKSNTLEQSRMAWLASLDQKIQKEQLAQIKLKTTSQFVYQTASAFFIVIFIFFSVRLFHAQLEQLLLIIVIFSRLWPRFNGIQSNMESIAATIPAFTSLMLLHIESKEANEFTISDQSYTNIKPIGIDQLLECRNVFFRYNRKEPLYALRDVDLQIPSNRMTAIVGRSGAGKSTLIDILMGLILPEEGQVLIDGVPLTREKLLAFRHSISYVPQDPFLFNASIRENMLLVKGDAIDDEIWEALEFSASATFVRRLSQGLDTVIGDRGIRLSGGERQRLVLARAILRKPSILVLDEATSALDTENETKIQEALDLLKGKMTIIVIAHRLSTIRNADQVIVIDQGTIVQKGMFSELAKEKKSLLSHLLEQQANVWSHG